MIVVQRIWIDEFGNARIEDISEDMMYGVQMTMIEKVARAILKQRGLHPMTNIGEDNIWRLYDKQVLFAEAKAAIEAMKEPTDKVILSTGTIGDNAEDIQMAREMFNEVIEVALKE